MPFLIIFNSLLFLYILVKQSLLMAELRRAKRASGAPWIRFFRKYIHARNFGYDVSVRPPTRPPVQTVWVQVGRGKAGQPLGTGVFGQFFFGGKSRTRGSVAFGNPSCSGGKSY